MIYNESKFNTEWDTLPLSKLGEFKRGKSKHRPRNDKKLFEDGIYPLVQTGEIKAANLLIKSHCANYNEEGLKQSKMWPAGTLAITIAANIAETGILAYPMCFPDSCVGFIANKEKTSELFMHYVFTYIKRSIQNSAVGSIQDNINIEMLTALNFKIPKKPIQDLIVDLLATIDYKIELNNDITTELENLAKTIYNYWFVQFDFPNEEGKPYKTSGGEMVWNEELKREIPKGWKVDRLKMLFEIQSGYPFESEDYRNIGNYKLITIKNVQEGFLDTNETDCIETLPKNLPDYCKLKLGDILISLTGNVGRVCIVTDENLLLNQRVGVVIPQNQCLAFTYFTLQSDFIIKTLKKIATGSNQKNLSPIEAGEEKALQPDEKIVELFEKKTKPIFDMILKKQRENQELIKLRDFLLPLLMNGQVKVKSEATEQLSMAAEPQIKYEK